MSTVGPCRSSTPAESPRPPKAGALHRSAARLAPLAVPAAVAAVFALGLYLRLARPLSADFPLNDGGLFYLMTRELEAHGYALPAFTSYNAAGIPFAYPPLGFYLLGALSHLPNASLTGLLRLLPAVISSLTVPAFFLLARALLASPVKAAVATLAFTLLPRTSLWFVMGGGLTRSLGFLFVLLMLHQAFLLYTRGGPRYLVSTALLGALAVVSHLENTWFGAYSALLLFLFYRRSRRALRDTLIVVPGVVLLSAPWWLAVARHHGLAPFVHALQSGGQDRYSLFPLTHFVFTDEPFLSLLGVFGLIGVLAALLQGRLFLPTWLVVIFVLNPRNPATPAAVPLAMLAAIAITDLLLPGADAAGRRRVRGREPALAGALARRTPGAVRRHLPAIVLLGPLVVYGFMSVRSVMLNHPILGALSPRDRDAMRWVASHTAPSSRFALMTATWFGVDPISEWFPALTGRVSVATVQGYEWLPGRRFYGRWSESDSLQACNDREVHCLEAWARGTGHGYDYVYLRRQRARPLLASLSRAAGYRLVFQADSVAIFARVGE